MNSQVMYFNNLGYIRHKFSDEELNPIKLEINIIKSDFLKFEDQKHNKKLSGNIRKEYTLKESHKHIETLTYPLLMQYEKNFNFFGSFDAMTQHSPISLGNCWVNFQKKTEFNPSHVHDGLMSFVLYINVPFDIKDELDNGPGYESNNNVAAHFQFSYINTLGNIQHDRIPVDRSFENTIFVFPSKMVHTVYPFYTSDDYRISVSGNYYFDNSFKS